MKLLSALILLVFLNVGCKPEAASIPSNLAKAYGIQQFEKVNSIEFVFNVQKGDKQVARHWKWFPKDGRVILFSPEGDLSYHQSDELTEAEKVVDAKFVNDSYWLLFPFQVHWARKNILTLVQEDVPSPIGKKKSTMLTVKFKNNDGYTPGDAYDLYLSENNEIIEWVFRKGGGKEGHAMTWEANEMYNGVKIATKHQNKSGDFKLWFDGIVVE